MKPQETTNGQAQTITTTSNTGKPPMSIWWPMGILIGWIVCFIIGGGLVGAYSSSIFCVDDGFYTTCYGNTGEYYAGIAFIVIAVILKFVFWVLLIVRCVQRRGYVAVTTVQINNNNSNTMNVEAGIPLQQQQQPQQYGGVVKPQQEQQHQYQQEQVPGYVASQTYQDVPLQNQYDASKVQQPQMQMKYCGKCGTGNTTSTCSKCGSHVPM